MKILSYNLLLNLTTNLRLEIIIQLPPSYPEKNLSWPNRESSWQHFAEAVVPEEKSKTILESQTSKNHSISVRPAPAPALDPPGERRERPLVGYNLAPQLWP